MARHGKQGSLNRWQGREFKGVEKTLKFLSQSCRAMPLKNGQILVLLGDPKGMNITFYIEEQIVLDAAQAGIEFAEAIKNKEPDNVTHTETSPQPTRG